MKNKKGAISKNFLILVVGFLIVAFVFGWFKVGSVASIPSSFTGHTTSAAGGVEAILSILAIQNNIILPNLNFKEKMDELSFEPVTELIRDIKVDHVLSNSFGFGGNNTALIFSRY